MKFTESLQLSVPAQPGRPCFHGGFCQSLATKQTYRAKPKNEEGRAAGKRGSRHRKIVESDKVGIVAESYRERVKQLSPGVSKKLALKNPPSLSGLP